MLHLDHLLRSSRICWSEWFSNINSIPVFPYQQSYWTDLIVGVLTIKIYSVSIMTLQWVHWFSIQHHLAFNKLNCFCQIKTSNSFKYSKFRYLNNSNWLINIRLNSIRLTLDHSDHNGYAWFPQETSDRRRLSAALRITLAVVLNGNSSLNNFVYF